MTAEDVLDLVLEERRNRYERRVADVADVRLRRRSQ